MLYQPMDDSGEFNDSVVYLHPLNLTQGRAGALTRHANPEQSHLGIYDSIKLSSFLKNKQGKVIELISVDRNSSNSFVSEEAEDLLRQYATNEIAFVLVAGNQEAGKSFFCDKILNLCEIRGNNFCRKKNAGINIWSTPFEKDDLKIFLLEISGCSIQSQPFRILLTYSIMIGSAFIILDDLKDKQISALQEFDNVVDQIVGQMSLQQKEGEHRIENRNIVLPQFFYFLKRRGEKKEKNLSLISNYIQEKLPDALAPTYAGNEKELIHLPFLDVKCINQDYIRRASHIFTELYKVITQKKYNELTLNGSIILKIIKYVQSYINGNKKIRIEQLYDNIIEDLYNSAYNYCILSYHQEMERHFEDQQPKSLDQLLVVFETASNNVLDRFQEFNLDDRFHLVFRQKLDSHIDEKELMILDINKLKTQRMIHQSYESSDIKDYESYKSTVNRIKKKYPNLDHGQGEALGTLVSELFSKLKSVDYKSLQRIEKLNEQIDLHRQQLGRLKAANDKKSHQRSLVNKKHEELFQRDKNLSGKIKQLKVQLERGHSKLENGESDQLRREAQHFEEVVKRNNDIIRDLKKEGGEQKKVKEIVMRESRIEQVKREHQRLQKILQELRGGKTNKGQTKGEEKKGKEQIKKKPTK